MSSPSEKKSDQPKDTQISLIESFQKFVNYVKSVFNSATTIALYLVIIIFFSVKGLFDLFPKYDLNISDQTLVAPPIMNEDSTMTINASLYQNNENDSDSLIINLKMSQTIFPDTITKDTTYAFNYASSPFPRNRLPNQTILWLIIIIGVLGASIHGLTSVSDYVGNGTYKSSWALWYYLRPFVGALLALLSYWFVRAGFFSIQSTEDLYGVIAIAGLIGIFSKQALYKISDIANTVFTSHYESSLKDKVHENPIPEIDNEVINIEKGSLNRTISIKGKNFIDLTKVYYENEALPSAIRSPNEIEVVLNEESINKEGSLILRLVNPSPGGGEVKKTIHIVPSTASS